MSVYYEDGAVTLHHGDALDVLRTLGAGSVDCCVTSPPYFGLRDYGVDGQIGAEPSPVEYVAALVAVLAEVRRVLADDGTLWLNLGDSYASVGGKQGIGVNARAGNTIKQMDSRTRPSAPGVAAKNLLGIPWRVAFALQDDGWILRNDIIWAKPNAMPESVRDRLSTKHDHVFLLSKGPRYWFDLDPIREPHSEVRRNPGDVWSIPTSPFPGAHFATFPVALAERCILAGCKPGGTVLDPFSGSGTTGLAAARHGRRYVGIDLNREYLAMSLETRLRQTALVDGASA